MTYPSDFQRLIRKHHVHGSSTILSSGKDRALLLTHSVLPGHHAEQDTWYRVASITKIASALVCLRLYDLGKLELDEPVAKHLDSVCSFPELTGVSLRQLLSHTSGLRDPLSLEKALESGCPLSDVIRNTRVSAPGERFIYSNLGYGIAGCLMESVTGLPVNQLFKEYLFDPMQLEATLSPNEIPYEKIMPVTRILRYNHRNLRITPLGKKPVLSSDPLHHFGYTAGSMYITARSLEKLLILLRDGNPSLLSESSRNMMIREHASYGSLSPTLSYGLGLLIIRDPRLSSGRIIGHQGFAYGCADGAFFEEDSGNMMIFLNGGCSEARDGRLGLMNRDLLRFAFRKELPSWSGS